MMVEPVSREDIDNHPWLASWNKIDNDAKIDVLREKVSELEDNLGTASVIIITLTAILLLALVVSLLDSGSSISQIGGIVKQFTGK